MNNKGIAITIELLIALLVLTTFFVVVSKPQVTYDEPQYVNKIGKILEDVANSPELRQAVFDRDDVKLDQFFTREMEKLGLQNIYSICQYGSPCSLQSSGFVNENLYVNDWVFVIDEGQGISDPTRVILGGFNDQS